MIRSKLMDYFFPTSNDSIKADKIYKRAGRIIRCAKTMKAALLSICLQSAILQFNKVQLLLFSFSADSIFSNDDCNFNGMLPLKSRNNLFSFGYKSIRNSFFILDLFSASYP